MLKCSATCQSGHACKFHCILIGPAGESFSQSRGAFDQHVYITFSFVTVFWNFLQEPLKYVRQFETNAKKTPCQDYKAELKHFNAKRKLPKI